MEPTTFLRCRITPGQFSDEYAVEVQSEFGGNSLFASEGELEFEGHPAAGHPIEAWLRVDVLDSAGSLRLVRLPRPTIENGNILTVKAGSIETRTARERA